ncbi:MAG: hypothetical protein ABJC26_13425, partial [Gemmatimonadaceae bacterium]
MNKRMNSLRVSATVSLAAFAVVATATPLTMSAQASTAKAPAKTAPAPATAKPPVATMTAKQTAPVTLIKNATVLTVTKGTLANTDVLLRNGKIAQIGKNIATPAGAVVIDATGKFVMPGIIDPHSHMMVDAINEGSLSVTSMVRITDVLNPTAPNIYRALAGGVTTINVLHGSANTIGGQNATVKLKYGMDVSDMMFPGAPPGIKFALGENVTQKNRNTVIVQGQPAAPRRYPTSRMGQEEVLRDAFTRARDYKAT